MSDQKHTSLVSSASLGPREPNNDMVICPNCTCQFVAIPVNVQSQRSELLEALRNLLAECDRHGCFAEVSFEFPTVKPIFDAARAAVAKAEGAL